MIEVTMCDVTAEEAFNCIRDEAGAIRSLTSNPDTGDWVATVDTTLDAPWLEGAADTFVADRIIERAACRGFVAGHQGPVDPNRYSPENEAKRHQEWMGWFKGINRTPDETNSEVSRIGLTCKACGTTYSAEADETDGGVCRQCDEKGLA